MTSICKTDIDASNFWEHDLEDVESCYLKKGQKITELPTTLDARVPEQGSVILDKTISIDKEIPPPSVLSKLHYFFRTLNK